MEFLPKVQKFMCDYCGVPCDSLFSYNNVQLDEEVEEEKKE